MSNIYIQEPPTFGKILLHTTAGDIDIELWSREAPRACRNFVQLCLEGYYNNTIFHRLVRGFIVQGGDPTGTGEGGESIYGEPFKDEFHTRLRFNRRGLLAMANAGKDDNGSQFFFTLGPAPELQNKHTIFGKVAGDTVYNMLKLAEGLVDQDERPEFPNKILTVNVLSNPFPDIVPRNDLQTFVTEERKKDKRAAIKDFKLLSFGSEAEDDEAESEEASRLLAVTHRSKSAHDLGCDPSLSSAPALSCSDDEALSGDDTIGPQPPERLVNASSVREKLQKKEGQDGVSLSRKHKLCSDNNHLPSKSSKFENNEVKSNSKSNLKRHISSEIDVPFKSRKKCNSEEQSECTGESSAPETAEEVLKNLKEEYKQLRSQLRREHQSKKGSDSSSDVSAEETKHKKGSTGILVDFEAERDKYRSLKNQIPIKGASREDFTLQLLKKFQQKLALAKDTANNVLEDDSSVDKNTMKTEENFVDIDDSGWMTHKLQFSKGEAVLAKDANTKDDDWFDIYDPRNPVTKRRRETGMDKNVGRESGKFKGKL